MFWVQIILPSVGGTIALVSLVVAVNSLLNNLDRARMELAVKLIYDWASDYDWETSRALTLAADLDKQAVEDIANSKPVLLPTKYYDAFANLLSTRVTKEELPTRPSPEDKT